ncbi:MAG TPA: class I SAM-dependent methyltransferase [Candidatus Paceibacterota bacterium]
MKHIRYNNIEVAYKKSLHGGGMRFGQQYVSVVKEKFGHVGHIFEFCAGPGFIGFSLLANNLCDKLTLADVNPEAVEACNKTIKKNNLEKTVTAHLSDCLDNVPETEKWDLVVGNPPHVFCATEDEYKKDIILFDPNFNIHRKFYQDIHKFLKPDGSILLQEHSESTNINDFKEMIEKNGLRVVEVFSFKPPVATAEPKTVFSFIRKVSDPFRIYRAVKRRIWPTKPRNYYFIWCKLA